MERLKGQINIMAIRPNDTVDAHMDHENNDEQGRSGSRQYIAIAVIAGIVLFVTGFAMTLVSLPDGGATGISDSDASGTYSNGLSDSSTDGVLLLVGLALSMMGVVLATVIPAAMFIRRTHGNT
jgi:hypothetical protein